MFSPERERERERESNHTVEYFKAHLHGLCRTDSRSTQISYLLAGSYVQTVQNFWANTFEVNSKYNKVILLEVVVVSLSGLNKCFGFNMWLNDCGEESYEMLL